MAAESGGTAYCRACGAEIDATMAYCPECGAEQHPAETEPKSTVEVSANVDTGGESLTDAYSPLVWIASIIVAIITFPFGLAVPIYFYVKASGGDVNQDGWDVAAVLLFGIIGILVVEIFQENGAVALIFGSLTLFVFAVFLFFLLLAGA
jgi:hypothetical protein